MDGHIVHQGNIDFKEAKSKWKSRWAILEKSDQPVPPEVDTDNMRHSNYTSLVIRKNREGEVRLAIPLYYLCVVDKYTIDKKTYGITLMVANKPTNTADTYLLQCETQAQTDVWLDYFNSIVGADMHKFEVKLPKIIKTKYNGPGWLYFYEEQKFVTITTDHKIPQYYGTWPIQLLRKYGGDDPNKFVFESGRRCFGGVNIYHVASSQAYDIRGLCNKISSARGGATTTGCLANSTLPGYADTEPRYRNFPGQNARVRAAERPLTVVSNGSVASNTSKRSSGSSSNGESQAPPNVYHAGMRLKSRSMDHSYSTGDFRGSNSSLEMRQYSKSVDQPNRRMSGNMTVPSMYYDGIIYEDEDDPRSRINSGQSTSSFRGSQQSMVRQMSLDRNGSRPMSDTIDSGVSFRSSNNSILSNRSSRGSFSSDLNLGETEIDSGVDTLDSLNRGAPPQVSNTAEPSPQDLYMVMQPTGMQPITENKHVLHTDEFGGVYETMIQNERQEGYTTLRNGASRPPVQDNGMSTYMVPKPLGHLAAAPPHSPLSSPQIPGVKHINYPTSPQQTVAQVPADNYMNMGAYNTPTAAPTAPTSHSNYMNIDNLQSAPAPHLSAQPANHSNYMNIDMLSRTLEKNVSIDTSTSYTNMGGVSYPRQNTGASYGNYMNMPAPTDAPVPAPRKVSSTQAIYDTPTNHLRAYANVDNKCIAMSVSNPIYGNCGGTAQKLQT
ncbi:uncharacterized protein LOC134820586 isoform X3 [Bolinopsis microptera]|uniref:uncharacterized protein LOC134820586 isoform X3 n=1 Tax=Bolinopsis microptera TaxID=2820187 RepID=UPI00307A026E